MERIKGMAITIKETGPRALFRRYGSVFVVLALVFSLLRDFSSSTF